MRTSNEPAIVAIVDDDGPLRNALDNLIRSYGMRTMEFASAEGFLAHAVCEKVDVVVTDYRMPGMTGLDLLKSLRSRGYDLPVIIISAHADDEFCKQARAEGAFDCLPKPFEGDALVGIITQSLGQN